MFDSNQFKRAVKEWVRSHPEATVSEFEEFCTHQLPAVEYPQHQWLVSQSISWYRHVLINRKSNYTPELDNEDVAH